MATYVSTEYLQQVSRIRHNLNRYRSDFLSLSYINSTECQIDSIYDIWINLCLITSKIRPAFMIKWSDYLDPQVFKRIIQLLINYRDSLDDSDIDYRLLFLPDSQGIIITTYYTYYKQNLYSIYAKYKHSNHDEILLSKIFDCNAEINNDFILLFSGLDLT